MAVRSRAEEAFAAALSTGRAGGHHLEAAKDLVAADAKNPPRVRATVCTRCWYMDQLEHEVAMQTAPSNLARTQ